MFDAQHILGLPYDEMRRDPWVASLGLLAVEQIVDSTYVNARAGGVSLLMGADMTVAAIQLFADGYEGYHGFKGELPARLEFAMSRSEVRSRLGNPERSGEAQDDLLIGPVPSWDRFVDGSVYVHVSYSPDEENIVLLSLART